MSQKQVFPRIRSIYADHYVKGSHRAKHTPRVNRPIRPRVIAWAGPTAFMRDRWYERDSWYKARIQKPEIVPRLHLIDPDRIVETFEERTKVFKAKENDIGFKKRPESVTIERDEEKLEKLARKKQLEIDLDLLKFDHLKIYDHYNIFEDLFMPGVYFNNTQKFGVKYGDTVVVKRGNLLTAADATSEPQIEIESLGSNAYNTVLMLNMDGDGFTAERPNDFDKSQLLHWCIANISDGQKNGETIVPYLPPTPYKGTGYHRIAFILFRHKEKIDFSDIQLKGDHLADRVFRLNRFFKQHENEITPSALNFSQIKYDESVDKTLHQIGMKSPRFFYEWNEPLKPKQIEFPKKAMPFNHYLDMYRPPELVKREMFKKKLERLVHQGKCEKAEYPDIFYPENKKKLPVWQHKELMRENIGSDKYAALYLKNGYKNAVEQAAATEEEEYESFKAQRKETSV
uniref:Large ribosomal subunit protein mL38 n=1 Tax=Panagrolaimus superbus TaxID=310955 RepID=A0A914Z8Q2_9BILA